MAFLSLRCWLLLITVLFTVQSVSSIPLMCDVNCDDNVVTTDSKPHINPENPLSDANQARLFSKPGFQGSELDVPEGMTELAGFPFEGGSIVVREGWRVVITTLQGARFVEKLYVIEADIPHVSFVGVRVMRVLVERI
jgi:hypothetical protein